MNDGSRPTRSSSNPSDSKYKNKFEPLRQQRKRNKVTKFGFNSNFRPDNKSEDVGVESGTDICDCLDVTCPGCFFKCPNKKCKLYKCGPDCRLKRKFNYVSIEDPIVAEKRVLDVDDEKTMIHIS